MRCLRANASARFGSRAAMATIFASGTERAGLVKAMGTIAAAPSTPMRMGEEVIAEVLLLRFLKMSLLICCFQDQIPKGFWIDQHMKMPGRQFIHRPAK